MIGFVGKEGMRNLERERLSVHEEAMSHVIKYIGFFRVLTVTDDQMVTFFFFVLCPVQCVHVPASYRNLLPSFFRAAELV